MARWHRPRPRSGTVMMSSLPCVNTAAATNEEGSTVEPEKAAVSVGDVADTDVADGDEVCIAKLGARNHSSSSSDDEEDDSFANQDGETSMPKRGKTKTRIRHGTIMMSSLPASGNDSSDEPDADESAERNFESVGSNHCTSADQAVQIPAIRAFRRVHTGSLHFSYHVSTAFRRIHHSRTPLGHTLRNPL